MAFFRLSACFILLGLAGTGLASAQAPTPLPSPVRSTTVTLSQIVARQRENFDRIQNAQGEVVWQEERPSVQPGGTDRTGSTHKVIYFALGPDQAVTLVLPASEARTYAGNQGRIDWSKVVAANAVESATLYSISKPEGAKAPQVRVGPFDPAASASDPLVAFHPRLLAEAELKLSDLAELAPQMSSPPILSEVRYGDRQAIRIDYSDPSASGEGVYFLVDPARGYLPLEIGRLSQGRIARKTQIVIGHTKDGTWIPARRERNTFGPDGRVTNRESWHYNYLAVNEGLSRRGATLAFFHLPPETQFLTTDGVPLALPTTGTILGATEPPPGPGF